MKKLQILLLFLTVFVFGKAQVLDTISLQEFKGLNKKILLKAFSNNQKAIELINKNRKGKILAYGLYTATVPLVIVKNPLLILPLISGFSLHGNNSKQKLYTKLLNLELLTHKSDSAKEYLPNKKNTISYKFNHFVFDMSFDEFNVLNNKQLKEMIMINDTIKYIFEYCKNNNEYNQSELGPSTVFIGGGGLAFAIGTMSIFMSEGSVPNIPAMIFSGGGILSCFLGVYLLPPRQKFKHQNIQMQSYYGLKQYFTTHKIPKELAEFIGRNKK